jgi:dipeptidyl-peptidase 4
MDTEFLRLYAETRAFTHGQPSHARIVDHGKKVLFLRGEAHSPVLALYELDLDTKSERLVLRAEDLLADEVLSDEERARRERMRLSARGLASFQIGRGDALLLLPLGGRVFTFDRASGEHEDLGVEGAIDAQLSPDGRHIGFVRSHNLYVMEIATRRLTVITEGGTAQVSYGEAEFVAQEEMGRMSGYCFSADGRSICYQSSDTREVERWTIMDPLRPEREPLRFAYPRPGQNNAEVRLFTARIDAPTQRREILWDRDRFPYVAAFRWPGPLWLVVQDREQHRTLVLEAEGLEPSVVIEERDEAWVNLWRQMPMACRDGFLWISERTGRAVLSLHDHTGRAVRPLIDDVVEVIRIEGDRVFVLATDDPKALSLYEVPLDGTTPKRFDLPAGERGVHIAHDHFIDAVATPTAFRTSTVRTIDTGEAVATLKSVALPPPVEPQVHFQTVDASGRTYHAAVIRPRGREGKLPVLLSVYGGPHHMHVTAQREPYFREQWLADLGFIVVAIDNRGTPRRGREWERAILRDLASVPLQDQTDALTTLMRQHPEMDAERVGVFGWSYGGYLAALCVLSRPDVFKSGVAGAPVTDWLDYDTHYTERYLKLPKDNEAGYATSGLLDRAKDLVRPLLLIHGTADDNVYFSHTLKLSDRLTRQGISHRVLPLAGATHMVTEPELVVRLWEAIASHFVMTLA